MSGTSQWAMSEPNIALKRAPNGLTLVLNAVDRHAGRRPRSRRRSGATNSSRMSSAPLDAARRRTRRAGRRPCSAGTRRELGGPRGPTSPPYFAKQLGEQRPGRRRAGSRSAHAPAVALLPVADEVGVERRRPRHAALEEREVEVGEAAGDAAEEQRLGQRVLALAEHADVVVHVARDRPAVLPAR